MVKKGYVNYGAGTSFGNGSNVITLGQSGQGDAMLRSGSNSTFALNHVIAAAASGELRMFQLSGTGNSTVSGNFTLNSDLYIGSSAAAGSSLSFTTGVISGVGGLVINPATPHGNTTFASPTRCSAVDWNKYLFGQYNCKCRNIAGRCKRSIRALTVPLGMPQARSSLATRILFSPLLTCLLMVRLQLKAI